MATMHESLTEDRIEEAVRRQMFGLDSPGFCLACGFEQDGCEPDARGYVCESCGEPQVFGAQEALLKLEVF
jgi:hypothetical protein